MDDSYRGAGMHRVLLIVMALIVYGSLYPWRFHELPPEGVSVFWQSWPAELTRYVVRDLFVNVMLYMPLGAFGFLVLAQAGTGRLRYFGPLLLALFLSTSIEMVQLFDDLRNSSCFDVLCNVAGAAVGIAAGRLYREPLFQVVQRGGRNLERAPSASLMLFCCWVGYQAFPLFLTLSRTSVRTKLHLFFTAAALSVPAMLVEAIEWLAVAALLETIVGAARVRLWMRLLLLCLPVKLVISDRTITPPELAGAIIAYFVWNRWLAAKARPLPIVGWLMVAGLIVQGLAPYRFSATPAAFSWMPFRGFLESSPDWGALVFLKKSFWYGAPLWLFRRAGYGLPFAALGVAALLAAIESIQRYLPGRTAEISDPILAIVLAAIIGLLDKREDAGCILTRRRSQNGNPGQ